MPVAVVVQALAWIAPGLPTSEWAVASAFFAKRVHGIIAVVCALLF